MGNLGGGGGGGCGNFGTGVRASISKPTPFIYLAFEKIEAASKNLSEKYTHIPDCQKSGAFHIQIKKNRVSHILFLLKKGG